MTSDAIKKARDYRDSLSRTDPARVHLSILLDAFQAMSLSSKQDQLTIRRLMSRCTTVKSSEDDTLRMPMNAAGWDGTGAPV